MLKFTDSALVKARKSLICHPMGVAVVLEKFRADMAKWPAGLGIFVLRREVLVVAEVYGDEELESLRRFPEIGREELFRFFTLTPADMAFVDPGPGSRPSIPAGPCRYAVHAGVVGVRAR